MDMNERIKRINELYHKSQDVGLTDEEKAEQTRLRKEYIDSVKGALKAQLNNIDIEEKDGSITNLGEKFGSKPSAESATDVAVNDSKMNLRREMLKERSLLNEADVCAKSQIIADKLYSLTKYKKAKNILLYCDYNNEVATRSIIEDAIRNGKRVALPKCELSDGIPSIDFYYIDNLSQLCNGYKGICEPDINNYELEKYINGADLIICPGVVFDSSCNRIGYGKGYYDRFLSCNNVKYSIGLAFQCQIADSIQVDDNDYCLNMVITEDNIYTKSN